MGNTKFTVLGLKGAGKTCFMLGMYNQFCSGYSGYTLDTDDDADYEIRKLYNRINDNSKGRERFPNGTDQTTTNTFDMQYGYETILLFDWLDYAGGILEEANSGDFKEYEKIKKTITTSKVLYIFVDGDLLVEGNFDQKLKKVKDNCSSKINRFIKKFEKENGVLPPVAIVLTKADKFLSSIHPNEINQVIKDAFSPLFINNSNRSKEVVIIPVSLGQQIEDEGYSGDLKPIAIHLPIFFGLKYALENESQKINEKLREARKAEKNMQETIKSAKKEIEKEEKRWLRNPKQNIIQVANKKIEAAQIQLEKLDLLEKDLLKNSRYKKQIEKELKTLNGSFFVNGQKKSLVE